jgi:uncharacterized protein (TIGR03437 family)
MAMLLGGHLKTRRGIGAILFLLAIGVFPAPADQLPASCGPVGAKSYTPPAFTIPPVVLNRGTVITVTNATTAINGDTSSVKALVANPGPDGISLTEAITATNNDPGTWVIQFAPALKGSTIVVVAGQAGGLPYLTGGNVTINGDIDGGGKPGVTLHSVGNLPVTAPNGGGEPAINVISGGNTLYALALDGVGVSIQPPAYGLAGSTGKTFSNITIGNLVMTNQSYYGGIGLSSYNGDNTNPSPVPVTRNTWDHLSITGNTISGAALGPQSAISLYLGGAGDTLQHTTIANNNIVVGLDVTNAQSQGIDINIGIGIGSNNNQALDTLIANNTITAALIDNHIMIGGDVGFNGIRIAEGEIAASANLIDGLQIIANQIHIARPDPANQFPVTYGINVVLGDGASDFVFPTLLPIQYSVNNIARNIGILSNTIQGNSNFGIFVAGSNFGNANNAIGSLSILGNTMTGILGNGVVLDSAGSGGGYSRPTTGNTISNVVVQANSIQMTPLIFNGCNCYPAGLGISYGGIQVWAGVQEPGNSVNGLSILNNDVDSPFVGIGVIAGLGGGGPVGAPSFPADNNVVSGGQISCNQVDQAATVALAPFTGVKGINVVVGMLNASQNQVQQLSVANNLVGGVLNDVSLFAYLGSGGSGNSLSLVGTSGAGNGQQIEAGAVVNAATFQQRALAPGSLVSLFGSNLNGATVQFNGVPAPILYASSSQLNLQVPWELQGNSTTSVTVTGNSIGTELESVPVALSDPGIFSLGAPQGAIENVAGAVLNANSPAHAGDYILIFATGLGAVTPSPPTGVASGANPLSHLFVYPTATVGGVSAPVSFAGLAPGFIGLYQVNVQVPQGVAPGDAVPVIVSIGGSASNSVTISVR